MYEITEQGTVSCPYNPRHLVNKLRIQNHVVKCKEKYSEMHLVTCFYNYSHRVKPDDLISHYQNCLDKKRIQKSHHRDNLIIEESFFESFNRSMLQDGSVNKYEITDFDRSDKLNRTREQLKEVVESDVSVKKDATKFDYYPFLENIEELKPLPLPKTISKSFYCKVKNGSS